MAYPTEAVNVLTTFFHGNASVDCYSNIQLERLIK